jgi:hypothetical protein
MESLVRATEDSDTDESSESSESVSKMSKVAGSCLNFKLITGYYFIKIELL